MILSQKNGCLLILIGITKMKTSNGIALIQTLLIVAILSILVLFIISSAKSQVEQAYQFNNKVEAQIRLHSAEAKILFDLLTRNKFELMSSNLIGDSPLWNFYGKSFDFNKNIKVLIQDQSGLLNLHFINQELLKKVLINKGLDDIESNQVVDILLDWQDLDSDERINGLEENTSNYTIRNGAIPSLADIKNIKSISPVIRNELIAIGTIYQTGALSILNAHEDILSALIQDDNALQLVLNAREKGELSLGMFTDLTGVNENDRQYFYTSNYLMIQLTAVVEGSKATKKIFLNLNPYAEGESLPFNVFKVVEY